LWRSTILPSIFLEFLSQNEKRKNYKCGLSPYFSEKNHKTLYPERVFSHLACKMCGATADDIDGGAMTVAVLPLQPLLPAPSKIDLKTLCLDCVIGIGTPNFAAKLNTETLLA